MSCVEVLPTIPEGSYSLVDQQIVTIFQEGLSDHMIRANVIRGKPTNMARAIELATEEVMFRQMLDSRPSPSAPGAYGRRVESPMEVDHLRNAKCYECNGLGHQARNCPNRRRPARVEEIGQVNCWGCGSEGHFRRYCPQNRWTPASRSWTSTIRSTKLMSIIILCVYASVNCHLMYMYVLMCYCFFGYKSQEI